MTPYVSSFSIAALACMAMPSLLAAEPAARNPTYKMTRVGPPPGWDKIELQAVNYAGDSAGIVLKSLDSRIEREFILRHANGDFEYPPLMPGCDDTNGNAKNLLAYNARGQLLASSCSSHNDWNTYTFIWARDSGWTPVTLSSEITAFGGNGMNNHGTVVGSAFEGGRWVSFIWYGPGNFKTMAYDQSIEFVAINDWGDIAATVVHAPRADKDYDRFGVIAALIPHGGGAPLFTGDGNIDTLEEYQNMKHHKYGVRSHAYAINGSAEIAMDSPRSFREQSNVACRWVRDDGVTCAYDHGIHGKGRGRRPVGIDDAGNVVMIEQVSHSESYVLGHKGHTATRLGAACDPPYDDGELEAYAVSESGFVVGRFGGGDKYRTDAFILTRQ